MAIARQKQQIELAPLETRLIPVSYAEANELSGRVKELLSDRGTVSVDTRTNILVTSDHGFSTHNSHLTLAALIAPFAQALPDGSPDIVVTEGAINFRAGADAARLRAIVAMLQHRPEVGAIFTRPRPGGGVEGIVPGTLSFQVAVPTCSKTTSTPRLLVMRRTSSRIFCVL